MSSRERWRETYPLPNQVLYPSKPRAAVAATIPAKYRFSGDLRLFRRLLSCGFNSLPVHIYVSPSRAFYVKKTRREAAVMVVVGARSSSPALWNRSDEKNGREYYRPSRNLQHLRMPSLSTVAPSFKTFTGVDRFLQRRSKSPALHLPLGTSIVDLTRTAETRNSDGGARVFQKRRRDGEESGDEPTLI